MRRIKALFRVCVRAFGPLGTALGAVIAVVGEWFETIFGSGAHPFLEQYAASIGLTLFIIAGAFSILRTEWKLHELDDLLGNPHMRALWADGIPPVRDEYIRHVSIGNYDIVSRFWASGMSNVGDTRGRKDLHVACEFAHAAIAQGIIERGGNVKAQDETGHTPLMLAAIEGNLKVLDVLLHHECAINAKSSNEGCSALFVAAAYGHTDFIDMLVKHRAAVDAVDQNNLTPLMASIAKGRWETARYLLKAGADPSRKDSDGATVMDYAVAFGAPNDLIKALEDKGIQRATPHLISTGNGFSRYGHVRVKWQRANNGNA